MDNKIVGMHFGVLLLALQMNEKLIYKLKVIKYIAHENYIALEMIIIINHVQRNHDRPFKYCWFMSFMEGHPNVLKVCITPSDRSFSQRLFSILLKKKKRKKNKKANKSKRENTTEITKIAQCFCIL